MSRREASIEVACRKIAKARGYRLIKIFPYTKGFPDDILTHPRRPLVFVEMKRPQSKPSAIQAYRMAELGAEGYRVAVCYTVEQFKNLLNMMDKSRYPSVSTPGD